MLISEKVRDAARHILGELYDQFPGDLHIRLTNISKHPSISDGSRRGIIILLDVLEAKDLVLLDLEEGEVLRDATTEEAIESAKIGTIKVDGRDCRVYCK